jgi:hypothetical protein
MAVNDKTRKILWGRSGNRCAICRVELVVERTSTDAESVVGEECHIRSATPDGPRHDPAYPIEKLDSIDNLLLLCRVHHKSVDDQSVTFDAEKLEQMKASHERWVRDSLAVQTGATRIRWNPKNRAEVLPLIQSGPALLSIVGGAHMRTFSHASPATGSEAELLAGFVQSCHDYGDIWDDLQPREQILDGIQMTETLQDLRGQGFCVFGTRERHELIGGGAPPIPVDVAVMVVLRSNDPAIVSLDADKGSANRGKDPGAG